VRVYLRDALPCPAVVCTHAWPTTCSGDSKLELEVLAGLVLQQPMDEPVALLGSPHAHFLHALPKLH
jgi:hypothetical protein